MSLESGFSHEAQCTYQLFHLNLQTNADKCIFYHILKFKIYAYRFVSYRYNEKVRYISTLWKNINNFESNTKSILIHCQRISNRDKQKDF